MGSRTPAARAIAAMAKQEARHNTIFDAMLTARRVRPTLLQPVWHAAGYGLGVATALIGPEAAMACTVAVETEVDRHYGEQLDKLGENDPELSKTIAEFRAEEQDHKQTALDEGAAHAPAYTAMTLAIRLGCRLAIAVAKRV